MSNGHRSYCFRAIIVLVAIALAISAPALIAADGNDGVSVTAGTVFEASDDGPTVEITEDLILDSPFEFPDDHTVDLSPNATFHSIGATNVTVEEIDGPWTVVTTHDVAAGLEIDPHDKQAVTVTGDDVDEFSFSDVDYGTDFVSDLAYTADDLETITVANTGLSEGDAVQAIDVTESSELASATVDADGSVTFTDLPDGDSYNISLYSPSPEIDVIVQPEDLEAGENIQTEVSVTDEDGNPVESATVDVSVIEGPGTIADGTTVHDTDSDGVATFDDLIIHEAGSYLLQFSTEELETTSESFDVAAANPHTVDVTTSPPEASADGSDEVEFTATVEDEFGNPVEGADVTVDDALDVGELDGLSAGETWLTDMEGTATFIATSTETGDFEIQFSEVDTGITDSATATFVDDPDTIAIEDWHDLDDVRDDLDGDYVLVNNLTETTDGYNDVASGSANDGLGFEPLGGSWGAGDQFTGTFDGNGHEIHGLTIDRAVADSEDDENHIGLFGFAEDATITDVAIVDADIAGQEYVGVVVGTSIGSEVSEVTVTGVVSGSHHVGGAIGVQESGAQTQQVSVDAGVSGASFVGGIVGDVSDGIVSESAASGTIDGDSAVGGVIGLNNGGTLEDSFSDADVSGDDRVAGVVGENRASISETYAAGNVTGESDEGGLVGDNSGTIADSYWDEGSTGQTDAVGANEGSLEGDVEGLTTDQMTGFDAEDTMSSFDFTNTWTATDEYPGLQWMSVDDPEEPDAIDVIDTSVDSDDLTDEQLDEIEVHVDAIATGQLSVQLWNANTSEGEEVQELANVDGVGTGTEFEITVTVADDDDFVPHLLVGTADNLDWTVDENGNTVLTIEATPESASYAMEDTPSFEDWDDETADIDFAHMVDTTLVDMAELGGPDDANDLDGMWITTDAQIFTIPTYEPGDEGQDGQLTLEIAAPTEQADGSDNDDGYFHAFLPDDLLASWDVEDPENELDVSVGETDDFTITDVDDGVVIELEIEYSVNDVEISADPESPEPVGTIEFVGPITADAEEIMVEVDFEDTPDDNVEVYVQNLDTMDDAVEFNVSEPGIVSFSVAAEFDPIAEGEEFSAAVYADFEPGDFIDELDNDSTIVQPPGGEVTNIDQGTTFDTIQEAVDAADPGDILEVESATYVENVSIDTDDVTIKAESTVWPILQGGLAVTADGVTVEGFEISGGLESGAAEGTGISVGTGDVAVDDVEITETTVNGTDVGIAANGTASVDISGGEITNSVAEGVLIQDAESVSIEGVSIVNAGNEGILIVGDDDGVDVTLTDVFVETAPKGGVVIERAQSVELTENTVTNVGDSSSGGTQAIDITGTDSDANTDVTIVDLTTTDPDHAGMDVGVDIDEIATVEILDVTIENATTGILLRDVTTGQIEQATITETAFQGIAATSFSDYESISIANVEISNAGREGILVTDAKSVTITNASVEHSGEEGIRIEGVDSGVNLTLADIDIEGAPDGGLVVKDAYEVSISESAITNVGDSTSGGTQAVDIEGTGTNDETLVSIDDLVTTDPEEAGMDVGIDIDEITTVEITNARIENSTTGILLRDANNADIDDVTITETVFQGIEASSFSGYESISITDVEISDAGHEGILVTDAKSATVSDASVERSGMEGIRIEGVDNGVNLTLTDLSIEGAPDGGVVVENAREVDLSSSLITNVGDSSSGGTQAIDITGTDSDANTDVTIVDLTTTDPDHAGMDVGVDIDEIATVEISDVTIENATTGILLRDVTTGQIEQATITETAFQGIAATSFSDYESISISDVEINEAGRIGILVSDASVVSIIDATVEDSGEEGILIEADDVSSEVTLADISVERAPDGGVVMDGVGDVDVKNTTVNDVGDSTRGGTQGFDITGAGTDSDTTVTLTDVSATDPAAIGMDAGIDLDEISHVEIADARIENATSGIVLRDVTNVSIEDVDIADSTHKGISASSVLTPETVSIENVTISDTGHEGIHLSGVESVSIADSVIKETDREGVRISGEGEHYESLISNIEIDSTESHGLHIVNVGEIDITDSSVEATVGDGIVIEGSQVHGDSSLTVDDTEITGVDEIGVNVSEFVDVRIDSIEVEHANVGINLESSSNVSLTDIDIQKVTNTGTNLHNATDVTIATAEIYDSGTAIEVSSSENVTLRDSRITENTVGAVVSDSTDVNIRWNKIVENDDGIENLDDAHTVNATNNWWGATTGPGSDGPGDGDSVLGDVQFDPFLGITDAETLEISDIAGLVYDEREFTITATGVRAHEFNLSSGEVIIELAGEEFTTEIEDGAIDLTIDTVEEFGPDADTGEDTIDLGGIATTVHLVHEVHDLEEGYTRWSIPQPAALYTSDGVLDMTQWSPEDSSYDDVNFAVNDHSLVTSGEALHKGLYVHADGPDERFGFDYAEPGEEELPPGGAQTIEEGWNLLSSNFDISSGNETLNLDLNTVTNLPANATDYVGDEAIVAHHPSTFERLGGETVIEAYDTYWVYVDVGEETETRAISTAEYDREERLKKLDEGGVAPDTTFGGTTGSLIGPNGATVDTTRADGDEADPGPDDVVTGSIPGILASPSVGMTSPFAPVASVSYALTPVA